MKILLLITLLGPALAIIQQCQTSTQCPSNSYCIQSSDMCACNTGFIGGCNIPATPLTDSPISGNISSGQTLLFSINPMQLNVFIQFLFTVCLAGQQQMSTTFTLWGQTGSNVAYVPNNALGNPTPAILTSGCQQFISPYTSFGSQPNGQNELLIIGITDNSQGNPANLTISVSQQVIAGIFIYYYILVSLIIVVVVVIIIGVAVFIFRRRRRRNNAQGIVPAVPQPAYNNIEYLQNLMPAFPAEQLGSQKQICSICLQNIEFSEIVRQTPCKHIFHSTCIDSWCLKNLTCPVCRTDLTQQNLEQTRRNIIINQSNRGQQYVQNVQIKQQLAEIRSINVSPKKAFEQIQIKQQDIEIKRPVIGDYQHLQARRQEIQIIEPNRKVREVLFENVEIEDPRHQNFDQIKYEIRQNML